MVNNSERLLCQIDDEQKLEETYYHHNIYCHFPTKSTSIINDISQESHPHAHINRLLG